MRTQSIPRRICAISLFIVFISSSAYAQLVWYVDGQAKAGGIGTSWEDAAPDLQMALSVAQTDDQIWVAAGVYKPTTIPGNRQASFVVPNGVTLLGGFAGNEVLATQRNPLLNPTILSGAIPSSGVSGQGSGNSFHVVRLLAAGSSTVVDGFTIRDGVADGINPNHRGGGILINGGNPVVRNCRIENNVAGDSGGGIMVSVQGTPQIDKCAFVGNSADKGGGMANSNASPLVTACTFQDNAAKDGGGGMYNSSASGPMISKCTFETNSASNGGGIYNFTTAAAGMGISQCTFRSNHGGSGGALFNWNAMVNVYNCTFVTNDGQFTGGAVQNQGTAASVFANCLFNGNRVTAPGSDGGGMYNTNSVRPKVINCTFHANRAVDDAGGMFNTGTSMPVIANSLFWGNLDGGPQDQSAQIRVTGGLTTVDYCCVQGWTGSLGGVENYGMAPQFFSATGPDGVAGTSDDRLWLKPGSPYIDAADRDRLPLDVFDYDYDGKIDEQLPRDIRLKRRIIASSCPSIYDGGGTYALDTGAYELLQGDTEGDGDIDLVDFSQYLLCTSAQCLTPPCPALYSDPSCACVDFDMDGDVDLVDFGTFQISFTGF